MSADESTRYNVFEMRYKPEKIAGNRSRSRFVKQTAVTAFGNIDGKLTQTNLTCRWNQPYQWLFVIFACIRGGVNPKWSVLNANTRAVYHHVRQLEIRQTKKFDVMTTRLTSYDWLLRNLGWRMWVNISECQEKCWLLFWRDVRCECEKWLDASRF